MEEKGFRRSTPDEDKKYGDSYGLIPPESRRYQERGEASFIYEPPRKNGVPHHLQNDYRVVVWTTKRSWGWVSVDSAWVLILNGRGYRVHTSRPIIRKGPKFLERLFTKARDARWRVAQRPYCCGRHMLASHRKDLTKSGMRRWKSSLWRCAVRPRDKTHVRGWNDLRKPFPTDAEERIKKEWRANANRNKKLRKAGKEPYAALRSRIKHPWRTSNVPTGVKH